MLEFRTPESIFTLCFMQASLKIKPPVTFVSLRRTLRRWVEVLTSPNCLQLCLTNQDFPNLVPPKQNTAVTMMLGSPKLYNYHPSLLISNVCIHQITYCFHWFTVNVTHWPYTKYSECLKKPSHLFSVLQCHWIFGTLALANIWQSVWP